MATDLPIRCHCGKLQGIAHDVSPSQVNRVKCYCSGCQAFQHYLGRATEVLDEHGGSDVFQMSPGRLEFTAGKEHLACVRLTPKGAFRWYAACCKSPIGNTGGSPKVPFVGMIDYGARLGAGDEAFESAVGPLTGHVHTASAIPSADAVPASSGMMRMILRFIGLSLRWRLQGAVKSTPFFDPDTHEPVVPVHPLSDDERERLFGGLRSGF